MERDVRFQQRLPESDHVAFKALFDRFYHPLLGFFIKRGFSEVEAEDFVQETLLNAYRGFEKFRGEASETTWIFSIAGNIWLNHRRSQTTHKRRARAVSLEGLDRKDIEVPPRGEVADASALDKLLESEDRIRLQSAISDLPEGRRHALQLRLFHGMKYREIANVLRIEINTVKSQIFQAKKQLGERLSREVSAVGKDGER